jgi:hypothetical protein
VKLKIISVCAVALVFAGFDGAQPYYLSPMGEDTNPGTLEKPFATLRIARRTRSSSGALYGCRD